MPVKLLGSLLIIAGCGGFGCMIAFSYKQELRALEQLIVALDFMVCELQCKLTPLPELCKKTAGVVKGSVHQFFQCLSAQLYRQHAADVETCVRFALSSAKKLPGQAAQELKLLGNTLGTFDAEGQIYALQTLREKVTARLKQYSSDRDLRIRNYQTLGLCAGAALAILFV